MRAPFAVERGKAPDIAARSHCAKSSERLVAEIEIPERGEIGDAGLVGEVVVERPIAPVERHGRREARADAPEPGGIGQARIAHEGCAIVRIGAIARLQLGEAPIDRPTGKQAVICGIEIGRDVLDIPALAGGEKRIGLVGHEPPRRGAIGMDHARIDAESLQEQICRRALRLPHDDVEVAPKGLWRRHDEGRLLDDGAAGERQADLEEVERRHGAARVERERDRARAIERDWQPDILDDAAVGIRPRHEKGARAAHRLGEAIDDRHARALFDLGGKDKLGLRRTRGAERKCGGQCRGRGRAATARPHLSDRRQSRARWHEMKFTLSIRPCT